jgi:hypothetical protein
MNSTRTKIVKELMKFRINTSYFIDQYWGSKTQIKNETEILNELSLNFSEDQIEMQPKEDIIDWYERMLKLTKKLI